MSRGPGRWQRAILERLETVPAFYQFEPIPVREGAAQEVEQPRYALWRPAVQRAPWPMRARFVCSITAATARLIAGW